VTRRGLIAAALTARDQYHEAGEAALDACVAAFPVGCRVAWSHGRHVQGGEILEWSKFGYDTLRAKVRADTGREYWVHAYRLLDHSAENLKVQQAVAGVLG
jgi:hypothetical protein